MKTREVMSENPVCCLPNAQAVARMMCEQNIGLIPVVSDQQSKRLLGVITDRDLCCSIVARGLDAKTGERWRIHWPAQIVVGETCAGRASHSFILGAR